MIGIYTICTGQYVENFDAFLKALTKLNIHNELVIHIITDKLDIQYDHFELSIHLHYCDNITPTISTICKYHLYQKYLGHEEYIVLCDSNVIITNLTVFDASKLNFNGDNQEKFIYGTRLKVQHFLQEATTKVNIDLATRQVKNDKAYVMDYIQQYVDRCAYIHNNLLIEKIKPTLAIYFICTGKYNVGFKNMLNGIQHFYPEFNKVIMLFSDELSEYDNQIVNGCKIIHHHACGYPWPIVTLYKMDTIVNNMIDCDYVCYLNADLKYNVNFSKYDRLDLTKLTCTKHNWMNTNFQALPLELDNPKSTSYIGNNVYNYVNGGFFIGPADLVYKMCQDVKVMRNIDLANHIIPKWHDETYLNKWCYTHPQFAQTDKRILFPATPNDDGPFYITYNLIDKPKIGE